MELHTNCRAESGIRDALVFWWTPESASIVNVRYVCRFRCKASWYSLNSSALRVIRDISPSTGMRFVDSIICGD